MIVFELNYFIPIYLYKYLPIEFLRLLPCQEKKTDNNISQEESEEPSQQFENIAVDTIKKCKVVIEKEGKLKCLVCNKNFDRKYNMRVHYRLHTGVKPYDCHICSMKFRLRVGLKFHMQKKHPKQKKPRSMKNSFKPIKKEKQAVLEVNKETKLEKAAKNTNIVNEQFIELDSGGLQCKQCDKVVSNKKSAIGIFFYKKSLLILVRPIIYLKISFDKTASFNFLKKFSLWPKKLIKTTPPII